MITFCDMPMAESAISPPSQAVRKTVRWSRTRAEVYHETGALTLPAGLEP